MTPRGSELVDHHLDEANLRWGQAAVTQELTESRLCGSAIQPDEATDEVRKGRRFRAGKQADEERLAVPLPDFSESGL